MDFALNDEQRMLQESARRYLADRHPLQRARRALPWHDGLQRQLWREMADMGWMSLVAPEAHGGLGLGLVEATLIAEEAGRQLLNLPWAASAVLLPLWLAGAADKAPSVLREAARCAMTGERAVHCVAEGDARWDHAGQCSDIVVVRGWHEMRAALQLALCDAQALQPAQSLDPTLLQSPAATADLEWHALDIPTESRMNAWAAYRLMLAAELVGVAQAALDLACAHAKDRVQFGKPIGSYQAIKHQLADAWMGVDNARLAVLYAAAALDGALPDTRFASGVAEYTAIEGALRSTRSAIQVHGGMGFTWEHDAHLYLKRAQHLCARLGGASGAIARVESLALAG